MNKSTAPIKKKKKTNEAESRTGFARAKVMNAQLGACVYNFNTFQEMKNKNAIAYAKKT